MRSSRSHNYDHEYRKSDFHYHSSSSRNHSVSNGHDYRMKRSNIGGTNLVKRMKSSNLSTNENTNNREKHVTSKISKPLVNNNNAPSNSIAIDKDECHKLTLNGYMEEESEALSCEKDLAQRSIKDMENFMKITSYFKEVVKKILEYKNCTTNDKEMSKEEFSKLKMNGIGCLMELKQLNRLDKYRLKEARKRLLSAKDKVDQINLQLQNILYEIMHLQKEQKTCASFRSKDENLQLVDEQNFYLSNDFPNEFKHLLINDLDKVMLNKDNISREDLHKLHLAQLEFELKQRIYSDQQLKVAEKSRQTLEEEISSKKKTLFKFDPILKNVIDSTKPLVTELNVPLQIYNESNILATFLPQPLYILFTQLCAYKSAFKHNFEISIEGTMEEAQEFDLKRKNESNINLLLNQISDDEEENGQQMDDDDELVHRKSKKSRYHSHKSKTMENDTNDDNNNDNDVPIMKNSMKSALERKYHRLIQNHPLKIKLTLTFQNYQLYCIFTYFDILEIVGLNYTVENLSTNQIPTDFTVINYESNIFSKLILSNDTGYNCPNGKIEYVLRKYGIDNYSQLIPDTGYTYDWTQRMAGIEYLNTDEKPLLGSSGNTRIKSSISIDCLDKIIKLIIHRFQSRINLQEQLQELFVNKSIDLKKFNHLIDAEELLLQINSNKLESTIKVFEMITGDQLLNEIDSKMKKRLFVFFEKDDTGDQRKIFSDDLFDPKNFIFKLIIKNEKLSNYEFDSYIIIPLNYPNCWPFFLLSIRSISMDKQTNEELNYSFLMDNCIHSLEEHINLNLPEIVIEQTAGNETLYSTTLLLRQVYELQIGIDTIINANIEYKQNDKNVTLDVYCGPRGVNSLNRKSIVQGHDHSLKF